MFVATIVKVIYLTILSMLWFSWQFSHIYIRS